MRRIIGLMVIMGALVGGVMVWAAPDRQENAFELFIFNLRTDIEALADEQFGVGERPENWTYEPVPGAQLAIIDFDSETLVADLWFDNEQLADGVYGVGARPAPWFGATTANPQLLARNVRHDLELAADTVFNTTVRPATWAGAASIYRCDRTVQNVVRLIDQFYGQQPTTPDGALSYCNTLVRDAAVQLLPSALDTGGGGLENVDELAWWLRGDLERFADELRGLGSRSPGWSGNAELNSPTMLDDINADLELLASDILTENVRPDGWLPYLPSAPNTSYLTLRSNLELFVEDTYGPDVHPNGWQGVTDDPLAQCSVMERTLIIIARGNFGFEVDATLFDSPDYCALFAFTANSIVENPPAGEEVVDGGGTVGSRFIAESEFAFTYLDVAAEQYMGIMPGGTQFRAWYRNFQESNMMFVSGEDFAVYVDRRWTTMTEEVFNTLETLEGVRPLTFCDASWCNGPGPTPTPTGSGPLLAVINFATPPPTRSSDDTVNAGGKTQVAWDHVRVTYLQDIPERAAAQVALEICQTPQQITCEPVTSVFDNNLGVPKPVLYLSPNGLNVYEFGYGFIDNLVIEGATLFSPNVFVSDPTIR